MDKGRGKIQTEQFVRPELIAKFDPNVVFFRPTKSRKELYESIGEWQTVSRTISILENSRMKLEEKEKTISIPEISGMKSGEKEKTIFISQK